MRVALCLGFALVACSGGGDASDAGDSSTSGDAPHDAKDATASDDASDGGADVATTSAMTGYVLLREYKASQTTYEANASFVTALDAGSPASGCMQVVGSCCFSEPTDGGATGQVTPVSAGTITIKYAAQTIATLTPSGTSYATVSSTTTPALKWLAGDVVNVLSTGDTVHAFNGGVPTALSFANVAPALASGVTISKSQGFTISWTAATGAVRLELSQGSSPGTITCAASNDPGTMTIDKSLLANITAASGSIVLYRTTSADASPDNANVTLFSETSSSGAVTYSP